MLSINLIYLFLPNSLIHASTPNFNQPAIPACGVSNLSSITATPTVIPSNLLTTVITNIGGSYTYSNSILYVLSVGDLNGSPYGNVSTITEYTTSGTEITSFANDFSNTPTNSVGGPIIGPNGNIYLGEGGEIAKISTTGSIVWTVNIPNYLESVFPWTSPTGVFSIAAEERNTLGSILFSSAGTQIGTINEGNVNLNNTGTIIQGNTFSTLSNGDTTELSQGYILTFNNLGNLVSYFGTNVTTGYQGNPQSNGGGFRFYIPGNTIEYNNYYYTANSGGGIVVTTPQGFFVNEIIAGIGNIDPGDTMYIIGSNLYFTNGPSFAPDNLVYMSLSNLTMLTNYPSGLSNISGFGAGLGNSAKGSYFAPGTTPNIYIQMNPWWSQYSSNLSIEYNIEDSSQVVNKLVVPYSTISTFNFPANNTTDIQFPLTTANNSPGVYQVSMNLYYQGNEIGASCMNYTIGAPGDQLNMSTYGQTGDNTCIQAAYYSGTGICRYSLSVSSLLPNGPTGALDFTNADPGVIASSQEATALGVNLEFLLSGGGSTSQALITNGTWGSTIHSIAQHYASVAPDATVWDLWNEPNNTYTSSGTVYTNNILIPAYNAIKSVNPNATVIGGSSLGIPISFWQQIGAAGGFNYMSVIGIHPYTPANRSWEEAGFNSLIQQLKAVMTQYGAANMPIWDTESAWWSGGPENYYAQANRVTRGMLWFKYNGISQWYSFLNQGDGFGPGFSLISSSGQVKPSMLALMELKTQISNRTLIGEVNTNIPHTYAMEFGPTPGGTHNIYIIWGDSIKTYGYISVNGLSNTLSINKTNQYGDQSSIYVYPNTKTAISISSQVRYYSVPVGETVNISAYGGAFGNNIALASLGATATASSSDCGTSPSNVIQGVSNDEGVQQATCGIPTIWQSSSSDTTPTLTVTFNQDYTINKVMVSTISNGNDTPSLRAFSVQVENSAGQWISVGQRNDEFFSRFTLFYFPPIDAQAMRINVIANDYGGYTYGLDSSFASPGTLPYNAVINSFEAYTGTANITPVSYSNPPVQPLPTLLNASASLSGNNVNISWSTYNYMPSGWSVEGYVQDPSGSSSTPTYTSNFTPAGTSIFDIPANSATTNYTYSTSGLSPGNYVFYGYLTDGNGNYSSLAIVTNSFAVVSNPSGSTTSPLVTSSNGNTGSSTTSPTSSIGDNGATLPDTGTFIPQTLILTLLGFLLIIIGFIYDERKNLRINKYLFTKKFS